MAERSLYKSRLRNKGQITVPLEVRSALGAEEGDDLIFYTDEHGRIVLSRALMIPPEQAWFWSERWQHLEHESQADIDAGRVKSFETINKALDYLKQVKDANAKD
jgi:AbrB family looped-hinge helix DNA binding protein